jgi:hypothetical protein
MTLKKLIYTILQTKPETRDSDKKLIWDVLEQKGLVSGSVIPYTFFMNAPSFEAIRRCRQALQRSDRLLGKWLIQPTKETQKHRDELAKLKGYNFIQGQGSFI